MPDGVDKVKVSLVDDSGKVVLSQAVEVKEGYKFKVEVI